MRVHPTSILPYVNSCFTRLFKTQQCLSLASPWIIWIMVCGYWTKIQPWSMLWYIFAIKISSSFKQLLFKTLSLTRWVFIDRIMKGNRCSDSLNKFPMWDKVVMASTHWATSNWSLRLGGDPSPPRARLRRGAAGSKRLRLCFEAVNLFMSFSKVTRSVSELSW